MAVKIKDRKTSDWKKLEKELKELCGMEVRVGFQRDKEYYPPRKTKKENKEDGKEKKDEQKQEEKKIDVCDVAAWNELGVPSKNIPSRPFLRKSVDENKEKIEAFLTLQAKRVVNGVPAADVLKETGAFQVSLIQEKIKNGSYEENKEATIKRKGSDKPLIDTGRMRQSVHYVIEKKGNRKE